MFPCAAPLSVAGRFIPEVFLKRPERPLRAFRELTVEQLSYVAGIRNIPHCEENAARDRVYYRPVKRVLRRQELSANSETGRL